MQAMKVTVCCHVKGKRKFFLRRLPVSSLEFTCSDHKKELTLYALVQNGLDVHCHSDSDYLLKHYLQPHRAPRH